MTARPHPAPVANEQAHSGPPRTVSSVLGEIVWLMTQSPEHKSLFLSDLETRVKVPMMLQQFRIFYAPAPVPEAAAKAARESGVAVPETTQRPVGVAFWAFPSPEVEARLKAGNMRLRPEDWRSGDPAKGPAHLVELIAPFGGKNEMMGDMRANTFNFRTAPEQDMEGA